MQTLSKERQIELADTMYAEIRAAMKKTFDAGIGYPSVGLAVVRMGEAVVVGEIDLSKEKDVWMEKATKEAE